ncbi:MAG TPA: hypothetical protein VLC92_01025 [Rhodocyclaceae bacterium]|nr:hypothetical protein [Rhodocyclaceae bacterium]
MPIASNPHTLLLHSQLCNFQVEKSAMCCVRADISTTHALPGRYIRRVSGLNSGFRAAWEETNLLLQQQRCPALPCHAAGSPLKEGFAASLHAGDTHLAYALY